MAVFEENPGNEVTMKLKATLLGLGGLVLLANIGFDDVWSAFTVAGWGLLVVSAYQIFQLIADTVGWRILIPKQSQPSFCLLLASRWICASVNNLLPVAQIGGNFVRIRLVTLKGLSGIIAGASVVVDFTAALMAQVIFTLFGILLLIYYSGSGSTTLAAILSFVLLTVFVFGFYLAQHYGLFYKIIRALERLLQAEDLKSVMGNAQALDKAIIETYSNRRDFIAACAWRLLGWIVGTGEVWLTLYFLQHPVNIFEAFMLESMGQALRKVVFIVPGALGGARGRFYPACCRSGP
jgi:putative membrane protein